MAKRKAKTRKSDSFKKTMKVGRDIFKFKGNRSNKELAEQKGDALKKDGYNVRYRKYKQQDGTVGYRIYADKED